MSKPIPTKVKWIFFKYELFKGIGINNINSNNNKVF